MKISETDLAYAAGIIDGEGCISVYKLNHGYHILRVQVANTDPLIILWPEDKFGGSMSERKQRKPGQKRPIVWTLSSRKAEGFLLLIQPYLLLKKSQAELSLRFRKTVLKLRGHVNEEVLKEREDIAQTFRNLNRRGVAEA